VVDEDRRFESCQQKRKMGDFGEEDAYTGPRSHLTLRFRQGMLNHRQLLLFVLRSTTVNDVPGLISSLMRLCDGKGSRWSAIALWAAEARELAARGLHGGLIHDDRSRCSLCRLLTVDRPLERLRDGTCQVVAGVTVVGDGTW
jgi:hypothetical protein